jgi:hypothetical protein
VIGRLRATFQQALTSALRGGIVTPRGLVIAERRSFKFGSPSGAFEPVEVWTYLRAASRHEMMFGFVPYAGDIGLFCSVGVGPDAFRSGEGASVQLNLGADHGLVREGRRIQLRHRGNVTLGRGAIKRQLLASLVNSAAPEAAAEIGGLSSSSWPVTLGTTSFAADLIERLFLYAFALEQAKRLLSQRRHAAEQRRTKVLALLPPLDADVTVDENLSDADENGHAGGQGRALTVEQRTAIEQYAVKLATEYFVGLGYMVRELGKPYDLECSREPNVVHVEVKGTRGAGDIVEVTAGEVAHARSSGAVALFIVSEIELDASNRASGGRKWICDRWRPKDRDLHPITFRHVVNRKEGHFVQ